MSEHLRIWWIPQLGMNGQPFTRTVESTERAAVILSTLSAYDLYQFDNRIKPDYCNIGGLEVHDGKEWLEWENEEGEDVWGLVNGRVEGE